MNLCIGKFSLFPPCRQLGAGDARLSAGDWTPYHRWYSPAGSGRIQCPVRCPAPL